METPAKIPESLKFSYEDYLLLPEDKRYEIIDGDLYMTPAPNIRHQEVSGNLELILREFVRQRDLGKVYDAPCDVVLTQYDIVQPDIFFISKERQHIITEQNIQGAPDLIVEILSPSRAWMDQRLKKALYARCGVKEYWIVDPEQKVVEVYSLTAEGYDLQGTYRETDTLESKVLEGLKIKLSEIFA